MGLLFCILAFGFAFGLTRRSTPAGLGATLTAGYLYGILRARFLDGFSHFTFDAALAGLYLAYFVFGRRRSPRGWSRGVEPWAWALGLWPVFIMLLSPLLDSQPLLVQLVGLRASVMFLPALVIGARLKPGELEVLSRWVIALNLVAFAFAGLELIFGVPAFFPENAATELIYRSNDIGPEGEFRIPACFSNAHGYAITMLGTLPLLLYRWQLPGARRLPLLAVIALSTLGIFVSGARAPAVELALMLLILAVTTQLNVRTGLALLLALSAMAFVVATTPRFQRFLTLEDTDYVALRVSGSVNQSLLQIVTDYPMGGGLASAAGTSIPFFLQDVARPQIGLENEYSRLALEQGLIGLLLWLVFIGWVLLRWPRRHPEGHLLGRRLMWALALVSWGTAFIGAGMMTVIPATLLLMLQMGVVASGRWARAAPGPALQPAWVGPRESHP